MNFRVMEEKRIQKRKKQEIPPPHPLQYIYIWYPCRYACRTDSTTPYSKPLQQVRGASRYYVRRSADAVFRVVFPLPPPPLPPPPPPARGFLKALDREVPSFVPSFVPSLGDDMEEDENVPMFAPPEGRGPNTGPPRARGGLDDGDGLNSTPTYGLLLPAHIARGGDPFIEPLEPLEVPLEPFGDPNDLAPSPAPLPPLPPLPPPLPPLLPPHD